jgi:NAD(P)-dependent dehydrogenase (short-subunit alcohol dehydrogenase family)
MNECFATNTVGPLRVTAALLANLRAGERRLVANITSRMGSIADNTSGGSYAYRSSKAALNMANRSMAHELGADGILCVVFHPGWVQTDMGGANAPLSVEDSVRGLLEVMDGLTTADNGRFLNYSGEEIPW